MANEPPLILVDGSSYLYRAFHALPPLTGPAGQPTGAVYGVVGMLRRLLAEHSPNEMVVVFDAPGKTFRDDLFPEYKAHRPPMPAELVSQVDPLHTLIRALGMPLLAVSGVEADDVIATLATAAEARGQEVIISTGDKDLAQLVTENITLVNTMNGQVLDPDGVCSKFGVSPAQIVDYLTLVGDSVDNVPGVEKVGPKTAARWLQAHGSLEQLLAASDTITGKVGENLRAAADRLPLSRQLVTVKRDVPLELPADGLRLHAPDVGRLRELYAELGFRRWCEELEIGGGSADASGGRLISGSAATQALATKAPAQQAAAAETSAAQASAEQPSAAPVSAARTSAAQGDSDSLLAGLKSVQYHAVRDEQAFVALLERLRGAELVAFDTETTGLDYMQARIVGLSFALAPGEAWYLPLAHAGLDSDPQLPRTATLERLRAWLEDPARAKLGHHLKFDRNVLANHSIELRGIHDDTMLESYVLDAGANRHDLDSLAERHLQHRTITYEDVTGKGAKQIPFADVPIDTAAAYAGEDAEVCMRLHRLFAPRLQSAEGPCRVYRDIEIPLIPVLSEIERTGVRVDAGLLREQSAELQIRIDEVAAEAYAEAGGAFNLGSPKQIQEILFDRLGLPVLRRTPKGQPSTAEDVLEQMADEFALPRLILEFRGLSKLRSTYTERLPERIDPTSGRVHTSYHQAVASTGRLSSSDPNLQNIPVRTPEGRRIRQAFIAEPGHVLVAADYSQIELRIMAHLSRDSGLLQAFAAGADIHRATAAEVFAVASPEAVSSEQRRAAKAINFGLIYGMSAFGLARNLGIGQGEARDYIARYFNRYPGVQQYMEDTREGARQQGFVETLFGRRLYLPEIASRNAARRAQSERVAINAPMQGSAADIIKRAMLLVHERLRGSRLPARMIMQVHDELVFEVEHGAVPELRPLIVEAMSGAAELAVELVVDVGVGENWDAAH